MNSTMQRTLAVLLGLGAILMALIGFRLSTKPAPASEAAPPPMTFSQVVAAHHVPAGHVLGAEDVRLVTVNQYDPHGFDSVAKVVGKLTVEPVMEGSPLLASHFPVLSPVAQILKPGERGVAVKVNEVVGVGGFLMPGDHVDVLLYLRGDKETGNTSSAQVVLRDVRVLAYGEQTAVESKEKPLVPVKTSATETPSVPASQEVEDAKEVKKLKDGQSAILAVPEKDVPRLMLAESRGVIRLAMRGAEPANSSANDNAARFVSLTDLVPGTPSIATRPSTNAAAATIRKINNNTSTKRASETGSRVSVYRGDEVEVVTVRN